MVYVFLATGYEEVEALTPVDVLRRAGVEVNTVSIYDTPEVVSAHGVSIKADITLNEVDWQGAEMLVLPGGLPGSTNLNDCQPLRDALKAHCTSGRWTAAICAAPLVLGGLGLLNGKHATCYPGFEKYMDGAIYTAQLCSKDGNIITGEGPAASLPFAYTLLEALKGDGAADALREGMMFNHLMEK